MEKLRKAVHPNGAVATPAPPLKDATPAGGTAQADEENAQRLAQAKLMGQPKLAALESYTVDHFGTPFAASTSDQQLEAMSHISTTGRAPKVAVTIVPDKNSSTGFSKQVNDELTGQLIATVPDIVPPRGDVSTTTDTSSVDQFGNRTSSTSTRSPVIPGVGKTPPLAKPAGGVAAPVTPVAPKRVGGVLAGAPRPSAKPSTAPAAPKTLDAQGHIPAGAANPQVVEAANQLLDGQDISKLPLKAKEPAAALARQYGWEQGTFTPKEKVLLNESSTFLTEAAKNPALAVLDSPVSRARIAQLIGDQQKKGTLGKLLTIGTSMGESPQEAEFVRMYNQLVGTISGLSQLTRSGKATEQTINRLVNELPNPLTTTSSADAKKRLARLQQELQVATQKGTMAGGGSSPASALSGGMVNVDPKDLEDGQ